MSEGEGLGAWEQRASDIGDGTALWTEKVERRSRLFCTGWFMGKASRLICFSRHLNIEY